MTLLLLPILFRLPLCSFLLVLVLVLLVLLFSPAVHDPNVLAGVEAPRHGSLHIAQQHVSPRGHEHPGERARVGEGDAPPSSSASFASASSFFMAERDKRRRRRRRRRRWRRPP